MNVLIRKQIYRWTCPECGPIEDYSLEIQADGKGVGRWFEDGHQAFSTVDENRVEYLLTQHLGLDFLILEHIRSQRSRRRQTDPDLRAELDDEDRRLLDQRLAIEGHQVQRRVQIFQGLDSD